MANAVVALGVDDDGVAAVTGLVRHLNGEEEQLQLDEAQLGRLSKGHVDEGGGEVLRVHLTASAAQVIVLPGWHVRRLFRSKQSKKDLIKSLNLNLSKSIKTQHTVLKDLMAKRLAIIVLKPGARQDCAMKPSFSSLTQITSSPLFQFHEGMFSR